MSDTENTNIENEQEFINMSNQLKEQYDIFDKENSDLKNEMYDIKKDIMSIYGLIRVADDFNTNYVLDSNEQLQFLIEAIRSLCSGLIESHILE